MCNSYGYTQLKSEHIKQSETGDENVIRKSQQSCLSCVGKINQKLKLLPSSVNSEAHARKTLEVSRKYKKESQSKYVNRAHE